MGASAKTGKACVKTRIGCTSARIRAEAASWIAVAMPSKAPMARPISTSLAVTSVCSKIMARWLHQVSATSIGPGRINRGRPVSVTSSCQSASAKQVATNAGA